ncbi:phage Gp37/Gp68 family protein [Paraburkholderia sp. CNPSo 3076]|uniref:phage Gp37/Gp68 family protein n=1 Tax=Paraburkholderia sp. CNPSo 3076 TaxID=2940936 RepID=UPI002253FA69|nr:phage Gp37/Gp68 family protein [Paraburkholderia sp. CNPSo 3076]MCX5545505.1 phage Gp37/Gp68 family protein [Paraburkholderia sp. CNPSo 3076]
MENTTIEWADHTFNPFLGCSKVSPGCDHCYAEQLLDKRLQKVAWGPSQPRVRTSPANWRKPLTWNTRHDEFFAIHGRRQRVFCASLADVFDNAVDPAWRADLFDLIDRTPNLDWLLLTKRIGNVMPMINETAARRFDLECLHEPRLPDNVWLGATIVNQTEADRDIPKLLEVPARIKFLSMEPLLGSVDISDWLVPAFPHCAGFEQGGSMEDGYCAHCAGHKSDPIHRPGMHDFVDWVICGGESGPHARPPHPAGPRALRDQCATSGTAYHFKQWGEWAPAPEVVDAGGPLFHRFEDGTWMQRVGKKAAGRLLDGRMHNDFPTPRMPLVPSPA